MASHYDLVIQLTSRQMPDNERLRVLNDFAYELGWFPSDRMGGLTVSDLANAHLIVEHGLENTAVITFLRDRTYADLSYSEKKRILTISYNNLVDWHIQIDTQGITFVFNRRDDYLAVVDRRRISRDSVDTLRSEAFERVMGKKPNPNIPALDSALIDTISFWKRNLSAEMGYSVSNESLSALFNAIIFARAAEDHHLRLHSTADSGGASSPPALLESWDDGVTTLREVVLENLGRFIEGDVPEYLVDEAELACFDSLNRETVYTLLHDFYHNKYAPYEYDFSLMSKHALSRIYEHYVSILRLEESLQHPLPLFPRLPEEEVDKAYGSIYTPQFIARFFARYLREQMPPLTYRHIRTADPACGSGIFLRTLLELQCDPAYDGVTTEFIETAFGNVLGVDVDPNACQATRLSLALLHLVLTSQLPPELDVHAEESIAFYEEHPELEGAFDAVVANPPFVALDTQTPRMRERVAAFIGDYASGRIDLFLAFLKMGLEMLKPGGYGLFVLPHSFLLSKSASGMRRLIGETSWIRCLADLSSIRVFQDTESYVVLLVFQKKPEAEQSAPAATIIKCQDLVGQALQDAVEGRLVEGDLYSIYNVEQELFEQEEWLILPPTEARLRKKLEGLKTLEDFLHVREGFISGADDVFIVSQGQIPAGEEDIFVPYLRDRDMRAYAVPDTTSLYFFYPYLEGRRIEEAELRERFPRTWDYLQSRERKLRRRAPVRKGNLDWWRPVRPRPPEHMMRPKIISPHLALVPRYSLDIEGKYAISRAPLMYPKEAGAEEDLLRFFVAVLNSTACYWYVSAHSHSYQGGYAMLEPRTLRKTPVPDPARVSSTTMRRLFRLVDERVLAEGSDALETEKQIDELVADLYGMSAGERRALGMGN